MDFLDNAINKAKEVVDIAYKKTEEVVLTEKQRFDIASLNSKIDKDYKALGEIFLSVKCYDDKSIHIKIRDKGCGIENVEMARQPLYTTDAANERSGMGFTVMESFCDKVRVNSGCKKGTTVTLYKLLKSRE